ncbi:putative reverse transcriptase domain-containing protein [Tanacetum coccineum]
MLPTMITQSAGRPAATSRGGEQVDELVEVVVGLEVDLVIRVMVGRRVKVAKWVVRVVRNRNGDAANDNIQGDVSRGCTYKEFLACNPKEYDGKGGAIVYTRWIEKMESVQDMSGCRDSQKVKYTAGSFVGKALTWWNSQIHTRGREAAIVVNHVMVMAGHAVYIDRFYELARLVPHLVTPKGKGIERNVNPVMLETQLLGHVTSVVVSTMSGSWEPREPSKRKGIFVGSRGGLPGPEHRDGTFTLNDHYATTLFDSVADYSFVSTTFIPLLGIELSDLGFNYEIEIASGQLVEIDKVTRECKLEIEGHVFDINLIPFGSRSFDVIIGMDWLSDHKVEIICHEKVVRIPLLDAMVLRVLGEKTEEKIRQLMSAWAKEKKQKEMVILKDFPEVFPDDLSGLPPIQEIEFRIELIPREIPVAKSSYRLAPSELEELSGQLKELQDKGFIRQSSSP